ncbi:11217_t:CDS:1, partial [Funneliformis geosporum]
CHETTHTNFDTYENYLTNILKITDLNNLPLPPTDLTTLINFYLNPPTHTCPPCSLPHLPEPHVCPLNQINCSHTDYEQIKTERDKLNAKLNQSQQDYQKLQNKLDQQEQEIINLRELLKQPPTIISKDKEE